MLFLLLLLLFVKSAHKLFEFRCFARKLESITILRWLKAKTKATASRILNFERRTISLSWFLLCHISTVEARQNDNQMIFMSLSVIWFHIKIYVCGINQLLSKICTCMNICTCMYVARLVDLGFASKKLIANGILKNLAFGTSNFLLCKIKHEHPFQFSANLVIFKTLTKFNRFVIISKLKSHAANVT